MRRISIPIIPTPIDSYTDDKVEDFNPDDITTLEHQNSNVSNLKDIQLNSVPSSKKKKKKKRK